MTEIVGLSGGGRRRLAYCPRPLAGESLLSWINGLSISFGVPRTEILDLVGLRSPGQTLRTLSVEIPPKVMSEVIACTGLTEAQIVAMTAAAYQRIGDNSTRHTLLPWFTASHSAACVDCVAQTEGRWQLAWQLTSTVLCPEHRRYLVGQCRCGTKLHRTESSLAARLRCPDPRHVPGSEQFESSALVADLPAPPVHDEQLLRIAARLGEVIAAPPRDREDTNRVWGELLWAVRLTFEVGTPDLLGNADSQVLAEFRRFCTYRDSEKLRYLSYSSRSRPAYMSRAIDNRLIMAALIKVAGQLVFAEDRAREAAWFCEVTRPNWGEVSSVVFEPRTQQPHSLRRDLHPIGLPSAFRACGMPAWLADKQRTVIRRARERGAPEPDPDGHPGTRA